MIKYFNIIRKKPAIILSGIRGLLRSRIFKKATFRGAELAVTYQCQGRCAKCSCQALVDNNKEELSRDDILMICRAIVREKGILIDFTGGEPLLRPDINALVAEVGKMPVILSMATNAIALEKEQVVDFRKAGLSVLQFGLSSPAAGKHDEELGCPGSFAQLIRSIEWAKENDIDVLLNAVITKEVLKSDTMQRFASLAQEYDCYLSVILPAAVGRWKDRSVQLDDEAYELLKPWLEKPFVTTDTESCYIKGKCPAGTEKIYISAYGDVYPCPFIHEKKGNLLESPLSSLLSSFANGGYHRCVNLNRCSK
jgi:MoaA/NifB/PqqE/SkfB family radical SAM enzyme